MPVLEAGLVSDSNRERKLLKAERENSSRICVDLQWFIQSLVYFSLQMRANFLLVCIGFDCVRRLFYSCSFRTLRTILHHPAPSCIILHQPAPVPCTALDPPRQPANSGEQIIEGTETSATDLPRAQNITGTLKVSPSRKQPNCTLHLYLKPLPQS